MKNPPFSDRLKWETPPESDEGDGNRLEICMKQVLCRYVLPLLAVLGLAGIDQWVKYLTIKHIDFSESIVIWDGVFELVHVRNEGMAWGLLQNQQLLFILLTPIVLLVFGYFYMRTPFTKRFIPIRIMEVLLMGGAIGNLIDRIFRGEELFHGNVVDMLYFSLIDFPVFNVADSFITIACVLLVVLVVFVYKEDEFNSMFPIFKGKKKDSKKDSEETVGKED